MQGGPLDIRDKYSFDAPPVLSAEDWNDRVNLFCKDAEKFIRLVSEMSDDQLKQNFVKPEYGDYQRNMDVMIEHCYYHLGQIVLIKKLITRRNEKA